MKKKTRNYGFTLIEMSITIAVAAVISAISIPTFYSLKPNTRFKDASFNIYSDLQLAKITAIKENREVAVVFTAVACQDTDGNVLTTQAKLLKTAPEPGGSYTIFVDSNGDNTKQAGESLIKNVIMPKNVALCSAAFSGDLFLSFLPSGITKTNKNGNVHIYNDKSRLAQIDVTITGNVKIAN